MGTEDDKKKVFEDVIQALVVLGFDENEKLFLIGSSLNADER